MNPLAQSMDNLTSLSPLILFRVGVLHHGIFTHVLLLHTRRLFEDRNEYRRIGYRRELRP